MKLDVGKVVDNMTRGSCIPIDSVKSSDDYSSVVHILGLGHVLIRIRPIRHTMLVKVMICRVNNIQKRGCCVIWITIKIEKKCHYKPYHTRNVKQKKKKNKQISK